MQWIRFLKDSYFGLFDDPIRCFVILSLLLGMAFAITVRPARAPDELRHYWTAQRIAHGGLFTPAYVTYGARVAPTLICCKDNFHKVPNVISVEDALEMRINVKHKVRAPLDHTTLPSNPLTYLPASLGIFLAELNGVPGLIPFYAARIFSMLAGIAMLCYAIRITPIFKWGLAIAGLFPLSIFMRSAITTDTVTVGASFIFFAITMRELYRVREKAPPMNFREIIILCVASYFTITGKIVYAPILMLFLLVPTERFGSLRKRGLVLLLIGLPGIVWVALYLHFMQGDHAKPWMAVVAVSAPLDFLRFTLNSVEGYLYRSPYHSEKLHANLVIPAEYIIRSGYFSWIYMGVGAALMLLLPRPQWKPPFSVAVVGYVAIAAVIPLIVLGLFSAGHLQESQIPTFLRETKVLIQGLQSRYLMPLWPLFVLPLAWLPVPKMNAKPLLHCIMLLSVSNSLMCLWLNYVSTW